MHKNSFLYYCILFQNSESELENAQGRVAHANRISKAKSTTNHKDIPTMTEHLSQGAVWWQKSRDGIGRRCRECWQDVKKKKRKESSDYCILWDLPDLGAIPSLGAHMAWVPLLNQGRVYTAVPFINTFLSFTMCYVWRAQESHMASKPRVISRQNSAGLNFCWCWGFQLKPPPPWGMLATP